MPRARGKPSTNEFYRSVLDNAIREKWEAPKPEQQKQKLEKTKRLSTLYGYSRSSKVVKVRASRGHARIRQGSSNASTKQGRKSTQRMKSIRSVSALDDFGQGMLDSSMFTVGEGYEEEEEEEEEKKGENENQTFQMSDSPSSRLLSMTSMTPSSRNSVKFSSTPHSQKSSLTSSSGGKKGFFPDNSKESVVDDTKKQIGKRARSTSPPWYMGHSNSASIPPGSLTSATARYGHVGSLGIQRITAGFDHRAIDYGSTTLTLEHSLPKYLGDHRIVDEYQSSLSGAPSSWPERSNYVEGSSLKEKQALPELPDRMQRYMDRVAKQVVDFNESVIFERHQDHEIRGSLYEGKSKLKINSRTGLPLKQSNSILMEGKRTRYLRGMTAICDKDNSKETLAKVYNRKKEQREAMLEMKWTQSEYLYKLMRSGSMQLQPTLEDFRALMADFKARAKDPYNNLHFLGNKDGADSVVDDEEQKSTKEEKRSSSDDKEMDGEEGTNVYINRDTMVNAVCGRFEQANRRKINKLYSGFDVDRVDAVDYRLVMAAQRCIWYPKEDALEKIKALYNIFEQHDDLGILSEHELSSLLCICSVYSEEHERISRNMHHVLRPSILRSTILSPSGFIHSDELLQCLKTPGQDGSGENPLVAEFADQLGRRLQLLQVGMSSASVAPSESQTEAP